jgi:hypothetical protein
MLARAKRCCVIGYDDVVFEILPEGAPISLLRPAAERKPGIQQQQSVPLRTSQMAKSATCGWTALG